VPVPDPAIEIRGLVKRYGDLVAVDGLDLVVAARADAGAARTERAGKTSTVECCEGYRRPDAGTVRVLGLDPHRRRPALRPRVGVMLQEGGVYPQAYPNEVLRLFASFYADPLDPERLLSHVGLVDAGAPATGTCPAGRSSGWRWRSRSSAAPRSSSSTSPPPGSTPRPAGHLGARPPPAARGRDDRADHPPARRGRGTGRPRRHHRPRPAGRLRDPGRADPRVRRP
jgi:hypothetical protein